MSKGHLMIMAYIEGDLEEIKKLTLGQITTLMGQGTKQDKIIMGCSMESDNVEFDKQGVYDLLEFSLREIGKDEELKSRLIEPSSCVFPIPIEFKVDRTKFYGKKVSREIRIKFGKRE